MRNGRGTLVPPFEGCSGCVGLTQINWKFLKVLDYFQYPLEGYKCLKTRGTAGVTYER